MAVSVGFVGLPNVGKSTLFNALTKNEVPAENYPFCTIDPSVGIVPVMDPVVDRLSQFSASQKKLYAVVEVTDIAGLVEGASKGEGLGNQFLSHIREVDAIAQVVRVFKNASGTDVTHVYGGINPIRDIQVIEMELILADLQSVQKRREKIAREVKRNDKDAVKEEALLAKVQTWLEEEKLAINFERSDDENTILKQRQLLTDKPFMYVLNGHTGGENIWDNEADEEYKKLLEYCNGRGIAVVELDAQIEGEIALMDSVEERNTMREEFGCRGNGLDELVATAYKALGKQSFYTTGEKETRAWTINAGSTAKQAAGAIHTDFEKNFVKSDTIHFEELLTAGSWSKAREAGKVRIEGKEYIMQEGDVVEFKIGK